MDGRLRNMTAVYLLRGSRVLLLYRQGGMVVNDVWTGSAGGHFERDELNDARACVLRELNEELGLRPEDIEGLALRYIALSGRKGEIRQNYYFFAELGRDVDEGVADIVLVDLARRDFPGYYFTENAVHIYSSVLLK